MAVATLVSRLAKGIAAAGLAASISLPAWAQSEGELRAEQTALFQQMCEDPTNLEPDVRLCAALDPAQGL